MIRRFRWAADRAAASIVFALALQDLTSRCTSASSLNCSSTCLGNRIFSLGLRTKSWLRLSSALALNECSETGLNLKH